MNSFIYGIRSMSRDELRERAELTAILADLQRDLTETRLSRAETHRVEQSLRLEPWKLALAGVTTGAALIGAGAGLFAAALAFLKVLQ
jgi:hypothetical protein